MEANKSIRQWLCPCFQTTKLSFVINWIQKPVRSQSEGKSMPFQRYDVYEQALAFPLFFLLDFFLVHLPSFRYPFFPCRNDLHSHQTLSESLLTADLLQQKVISIGFCISLLLSLLLDNTPTDQMP